MKKLLFPLCLVLILATALMPGCDLFTRQLPVVNSFDANPPSISAGGSSTLTWNSSGAASVSIDQGIGNVALTGSRPVAPSTTTTYTLTATNSSGSLTATCQVMVAGTPAAPPAAPPAAGLPVVSSFTANPPGITAGNQSALSWNVSNATSVTIGPAVGTFAASGSTIVSPASTTTYTLTATNAVGSTTSTAQVIVSSGAYMPTPEPTPVPFAVLGVTATVDPSTFTGACPKNFNCFATITVNGPGTVTYVWENSEPRVSAVQTLTFDVAGSKSVSTGWPRDASGAYWFHVRTLAPNVVVSNQANLTLSCFTSYEPPPEHYVFQVQSVSLNVNPQTYAGLCPSSFTCAAIITVNGPGTVTYRWEASDITSAVQTLTFDAAGSQAVTSGWNPPTQHPWVQVHILSPNDKVSFQWTVTNLCHY
jgi:hypothetical protein